MTEPTILTVRQILGHFRATLETARCTGEPVIIALRRRHTALTRGDLTWVAPRTRNYLAYVRSLGDEAFLVECNTSARPLRRPRGPKVAETVLGTRSPGRMRPWEATIGRLHAG